MKILIHHGIKGQKWGVRNGPPYPIEDRVLRKGTRINSVSGTYLNSNRYKKSGRWMYTYRADENYDNAVYKGPFSVYLIERGSRYIREHEYEVVADLKMPTKNERILEFKNLYGDPKYGIDTKNDLERYRKHLILNNVGSKEDQAKYEKIDVYNLKTPEDFVTAYDIFNHAMEAMHMQASTREYARRMSKKFDAMVDDNNQGIYNDAHDPIIIFKANKWLKDVSDPKSPKFLTVENIKNNYEQVAKKMKDKGKEVRI